VFDSEPCHNMSPNHCFCLVLNVSSSSLFVPTASNNSFVFCSVTKSMFQMLVIVIRLTSGFLTSMIHIHTITTLQTLYLSCSLWRVVVCNCRFCPILRLIICMFFCYGYVAWFFLASLTACSVIDYWLDTVVNLSVHLSVSLYCNYDKNVWTVEQKVPPRNTILQLSMPYRSHFLKLCPQNLEIFVSLLYLAFMITWLFCSHCCKHRWVFEVVMALYAVRSAFSATAGLLVWFTIFISFLLMYIFVRTAL